MCSESMSDSNGVIIRQMCERDVLEAEDIIHGCFHPRRTYLSTLLSIDRNGFFVAIDTSNDRVIGVCSGPFIRPDVAFIGNYCVRPEYRGRSIGRQLFQCVMGYIGDRNCCLTTDVENYALYKRLGFGVEAVPKVVHYSGQYRDRDGDVGQSNGLDIKPILNDEMMAEVIEYDQHIHGYKRDRLLNRWLKECHTLVATDTTSATVVGYGCLKADSDHTYRLRPVYADNYSVAKRLIVSLMALSENVTESQFTIPAVSTNASAIRIAEELGFAAKDQLSLLFRNSVVDCDYERVYAIMSSGFSI